LSIRGIRAEEPAELFQREKNTERGRVRQVVHEVGEGLRYVFSRRMLWAIAGSTATSNFFSSMITAVFLLYAVRELDYSAGLVGVIFVLANVGTLFAALTAARITAAIGLGRTIWLSMLVASMGGVLLGIAPRDSALGWFIAAWLLFSACGTIYNIDQVSLRQAI